MAGPIVFISRHRIVDARRAELELAYGRAVGLIKATKPATALFAAYVDDSGTEVRIVHAFPDAAAMAVHFEGSQERTQSASGLITAAGFEIYGQAPATAVDQLRREAATTDARIQVFGDPMGGYLRAPR
jgi:hypothetical protein